MYSLIGWLVWRELKANEKRLSFKSNQLTADTNEEVTRDGGVTPALRSLHSFYVKSYVSGVLYDESLVVVVQPLDFALVCFFFLLHS